MGDSVYLKTIMDIISWYRNLEFFDMREDAKHEILDIYNDDGKHIIESAKLQIAINIHFIAMAYNDKELDYLEKKIMKAVTKEDAKHILSKISKRLRNSKFETPPQNRLK